MNGNSSHVTFRKLTVSQLKSLCKERRIHGYSKLTKDAIIQKLLDHSDFTDGDKNSKLNKKDNLGSSAGNGDSTPSTLEVPTVNAGSIGSCEGSEHALVPLQSTSNATSTPDPIIQAAQCYQAHQAPVSQRPTLSNNHDLRPFQGNHPIPSGASIPSIANSVSPPKRKRGTGKTICDDEIRKSVPQVKPLDHKASVVTAQKHVLFKPRNPFNKLAPRSKLISNTHQEEPGTSSNENLQDTPHGRYCSKEGEQDLNIRNIAYMRKFLSKAVGLNILGEKLCMNPDHEMQASISLRFVLTKLFFNISVGFSLPSSGWESFQISDAHVVIPEEIWKISLQTGDRFYVLEHTCEVISHIQQENTYNSVEEELEHDLERIRPDWAAYISEKLLIEDGSLKTVTSLADCLRWSNHEEYDRGISRLWLKRIKSEGDSGAFKRAVAERYIFACVMSNSISGSWMSAVEMSQEFNGLPEKVVPRKRKVPRLEMFLPPHHHVESIHFVSSRGTTLHPALAIVQVPAREYYILNENGMQVGCEEEGVGEVWMELLGCTNDGIVILT